MMLGLVSRSRRMVELVALRFDLMELGKRLFLVCQPNEKKRRHSPLRDIKITQEMDAVNSIHNRNHDHHANVYPSLFPTSLFVFMVPSRYMPVMSFHFESYVYRYA